VFVSVAEFATAADGRPETRGLSCNVAFLSGSPAAFVTMPETAPLSVEGGGCATLLATSIIARQTIFIVSRIALGNSTAIEKVELMTSL